MSKELSYSTPEGHTVFTSTFLKNRGTCCRSACLHCPFGFTLKKHGLQFHEVGEEDTAILEQLLRDTDQANFPWSEFSFEHIRLISLKGNVCGVFFKTKLQIKHLFLLPHFQHQGLTHEMVESYFFI